MSNSFKKNPVHSITCRGARAGQQKEWKRDNNRRLRRRNRMLVDTGSEPVKMREITNIWDSPCDGYFQYFNSKMGPFEKDEWRKLFGK